jgi:hypothetical protein
MRKITSELVLEQQIIEQTILDYRAELESLGLEPKAIEYAVNLYCEYVGYQKLLDIMTNYRTLGLFD